MNNVIVNCFSLDLTDSNSNEWKTAQRFFLCRIINDLPPPRNEGKLWIDQILQKQITLCYKWTTSSNNRSYPVFAFRTHAGAAPSVSEKLHPHFRFIVDIFLRDRAVYLFDFHVGFGHIISARTQLTYFTNLKFIDTSITDMLIIFPFYTSRTECIRSIFTYLSTPARMFPLYKSNEGNCIIQNYIL